MSQDVSHNVSGTPADRTKSHEHDRRVVNGTSRLPAIITEAELLALFEGPGQSVPLSIPSEQDLIDDFRSRGYEIPTWNEYKRIMRDASIEERAIDDMEHQPSNLRRTGGTPGFPDSSGRGDVPPLMLTISEVCQALGISRSTLSRMRAAGTAPRVVKVGRSLRCRSKTSWSLWGIRSSNGRPIGKLQI